jgi:hypothetical protein
MASGKGDGSSGGSLFWGVLIVIGLIIWAVSAQKHDPPQQQPVKVTHQVSTPRVIQTPTTVACNYTPPPGVPNLVCDKDGNFRPITITSPGATTTGHGGYENPATGDDGTADCSPGQAPVYVGSSDPNGLDGDGDGIGCE